MSDQQPHVLHATSTVIELVPDKKYLLVFKGDSLNQEAITRFQNMLSSMDIHTVSVSLSPDTDLDVIVLPDEKEQLL